MMLQLLDHLMAAILRFLDLEQSVVETLVQEEM
jgi:hypothetical protein